METMNAATIAARIAALEAKEAALTQREAELAKKLATKSAGRITFKVAPKGGASVYGLGRHPVTLYASQWNALIGVMPELKAFLQEHDALLSKKA